MRIKIDIDCTPAEARAFFGLPDLAPMQEQLMAQVQDKMKKSIDSMDPTEIIQSWLPAGMEGFDKMQDMFWKHISSTVKNTDNK